MLKNNDNLANRIANLAIDYDFYEFRDAWDTMEECEEQIKKMLCGIEQVKSLIAFCNDAISQCVDALADGIDMERELREQFVFMHKEASEIRRELVGIYGRLHGREFMLLTNNQRKMAGLPMHRKVRGYRCKADEAVTAFLDYCNGRWD